MNIATTRLSPFPSSSSIRATRCSKSRRSRSSTCTARTPGIFPKIEDALNGKKVGDSISITLEPVDAFGEYDAKMIRIEPVADLPPDIAIGGYLVAEQDGAEVVWRVTGIADGKAVLDGNHELAGQRLRFDCSVLGVRAASAEEIAHGHAHGPTAITTIESARSALGELLQRVEGFERLARRQCIRIERDQPLQHVGRTRVG